MIELSAAREFAFFFFFCVYVCVSVPVFCGYVCICASVFVSISMRKECVIDIEQNNLSSYSTT